MVTWRGLDAVRLEQVRVYASGARIKAYGGRIIAAANDEHEAFSASYELITNDRRRHQTLLRAPRRASGESQLANINRDGEHNWLVQTADGTIRSDFNGAEDIDMALSPMFNAPPIRRYAFRAGRRVPAGEHAQVPVVYLYLPEARVEAATMNYTPNSRATRWPRRAPRQLHHLVRRERFRHRLRRAVRTGIDPKLHPNPARTSTHQTRPGHQPTQTRPPTSTHPNLARVRGGVVLLPSWGTDGDAGDRHRGRDDIARRPVAPGAVVDEDLDAAAVTEIVTDVRQPVDGLAEHRSAVPRRWLRASPLQRRCRAHDAGAVAETARCQPQRESALPGADGRDRSCHQVRQMRYRGHRPIVGAVGRRHHRCARGQRRSPPPAASRRVGAVASRHHPHRAPE